ncbi:MAG TPA: biopolymer transporter ExbD [Gemmatimonadales bacterium]|jgi:biopolymer transport protein ExbD|nr:biopolymer transporter ExbD [Gemmatimonadales bacterium]
MAMSAGGSSGGVNSEINVTPMIDVLLVLLIIFMIIQPLNRKTIKIQVPPPQTAAVPPGAQSNQIVLEIKDDGTFAINGQPCPKDQLDAQIHSIYDARPVKLLFVKPGLSREYQDIIEAMDIARGAGVEVIGFTPADVARGG